MQTVNEQKFLKTFGKRVAALRKKAELTQPQLAEIVEVSTVTIANIETGKQWVRPKTLGKLSKSRKTSISDLFAGL